MSKYALLSSYRSIGLPVYCTLHSAYFRTTPTQRMDHFIDNVHRVCRLWIDAAKQT